MAGDPENSYDVDFIPLRTGKPYIVDFILDKFAIERENSFAFGDSGNDVDMLKKNRTWLSGGECDSRSQVAPFPYDRR